MTTRRAIPEPPPRPLAYAWYGLAGGLCGGAVVGAVEALARLSLIRPTEYEALAYAYVLYGGIGAVLGLGGGVLLVPVGWWLGVTPARAWSLAFHGVAAVLGVTVIRAASDASSPLFEAAPAGLGLVALVGIWLGGHLLTKTPLRMLHRPRGTAASWGGGLVVVTLLSLAPAPGAVGTLAPHRPQAATAAPDVVLVVIDGLRADALGRPGATPALDAFAADAVVFEQHVAASASTGPAVGALFSGRSPSRQGSAAQPGALADDVVTLAEHLRDAGYATGGLPNTPELAATFGFDQGFDWYAFDPAYPLGASASTHTLALYGVVARLYKRLDPTERISDHFRPAADQLTRARAFLDANAGDRAFVFVHLVEPAGPWFPAPFDGTAYTRADHPTFGAGEGSAEARARYAGAVDRVDGALGAFFGGLRSAGRYDDALVIVTGDHGLELGDHGGAWDGETLYDELVHVPLLVKLPGNARAGTRVPWQVRQVDLAPTLADLAGLAPDPGWEGASLFEDAFDDHLARLLPPEPFEDEDEADRLARSAFVAPTWADHPGSRDALSELDHDGTVLQSVRSGGLKLVQVLSHGPGARRLPSLACYDLLVDPGESRDLTRDDPTCPARLAARLHALVASVAPRAPADEGGVSDTSGADTDPEAQPP